MKVSKEVLESLKRELKVVEEMEAKEKRQKFILENRFKLLKERTFLLHNVCPDCKGEGGAWESCYHNDVEWVKCKRCESNPGRYIPNTLTQYIDSILLSNNE